MTPTSVILEFYDTTCARQNAIVRLSAGDVNLVDLRHVVAGNTFGAFQQGLPDRVRSISSEVRGHYLLLPIGQIVGAALPTLGWLSIPNHVTDDSGVPFGLVGLYLQSLIGPGRSRGMAIRLSADPSPRTYPVMQRSAMVHGIIRPS